MKIDYVLIKYRGKLLPDGKRSKTDKRAYLEIQYLFPQKKRVIDLTESIGMSGVKSMFNMFTCWYTENNIIICLVKETFCFDSEGKLISKLPFAISYFFGEDNVLVSESGYKKSGIL